MSRESITIKIFQYKMKTIVFKEPYKIMFMRLKMTYFYISSIGKDLINKEFHKRWRTSTTKM
jgi:hypothetical protein